MRGPKRTRGGRARMLAPSACRKFRYVTRKEAAQRAARARARTGDVIRPYRCATCHAWHIGHPPRHQAKAS